MLSNADMHAMELFKTFYWLSSYPVLMNKGVSFERNCGAASVGEYSW